MTSKTSKPSKPPGHHSAGAMQLMVAAEKLFGLRGIEAVSLREIAAAANNANNSAVQYHFGNKENLVQAVFEMHMPTIDKARANHLTTHRKPGCDELKVLVEALLLPVVEVLDEQKLDSFVMFMSSLAHRDNSEHPFFRSANKAPVSMEIFAELAKHFQHLPEEAFSLRLRLACDLFLDSIAEFKRLKKHQDHPYQNRQTFCEEIIEMALAVLKTPHTPLN